LRKKGQMSISKLAILGGTPALSAPLNKYRSMGAGEREAVLRVLDSDCLSGFYGSPGDEFYGGPEVQAFEKEWSERYQVAHTISVNSATSGLFAAMGAIGLSPGDEVIVPPWTMSATVMAPLVYGGIPVFVDIEDETFCLDPAAVEAEISPRTRAILAVNLFGHPARLRELRTIADKHGIYLIEDNAQTPLGEEYGKACGTIGHIGIFSLNYHKHLHTGEGGMCITSDPDLAKRLLMIRNHGENAVEWLELGDAVNMIGFNYRMTELSAAIGREQLRNIDRHVSIREAVAERLSAGVAAIDGFIAPKVREGCRHNYYCWTVRIEEEKLGVDRDTFTRALRAEGFPLEVGYAKPLYMLPLFQQKIAIGREGFPFTISNRRYTDGMCAVTERLHGREAWFFEPCAYDLGDGEVEALVAAIFKVCENISTLRKQSAHI
jgi:perosamine synthetase